MLQAAGMHTEVLETRHAGHATEIARKLDLSQSSALVMVGGDGTVHEVLQVGRQPRVMSCGCACLAVKAWCLQKADVQKADNPNTCFLKGCILRSVSNPTLGRSWCTEQRSTHSAGAGVPDKTFVRWRRCSSRQCCCTMGLSAVLRDWCCDLHPMGHGRGVAHSAAGGQVQLQLLLLVERPLLAGVC